MAIPVLLGITSLVAELGHGLLIKARNQRVADLAAYAGALAYNATSSTTSMTAAAKSTAALNGIPANAVAVSLATSPRAASSQAVLVRIATNTPVLLAPVIKVDASMSIGASAYAQLGGQTPACIIALNASGTGVTLSGGTAITATSCAVASNSTVTVPCGTTISAKGVVYGTTLSQGCSGITAQSITKATTSDPLAGNTGISNATSRMSTVAALTAPAAPSAPVVSGGKPIEFGWNATSTQSQATAIGCTASFSSPTWTLTCPNGGSYTFSTFLIDGGINLNFNTSGTGASTYNFTSNVTTSATTTFGPGTYNFALGLSTAGTTSFGAGTYTIGGGLNIGGGSTTTFGAGTFNIAGGINTGGGSTSTFGAGTFNIGALSATCGSGGKYSICHTGTSLTFAGPSTFNLRSGIYNASTVMTLGSGASNSFKVGASSDGNALYVGGGSTTTFADATAAGSVFQLNGNVGNGGGSCTTFSAASQHDINGSVTMMGGTMLGTGTYTINGSFSLGASGGGAVTCNGTSIGMSGNNVTLVISGTNTPTSGTCNGLAFCIAGGYSNVSLTAPTSGTLAGLAVIGPTVSGRTGGATLAQGASGASVSGAFYFPLGPISMSGGASIGNGPSQCLELIGTQVSLSGGTTAASTCISGTSGAPTTISIVQ